MSVIGCSVPILFAKFPRQLCLLVTMTVLIVPGCYINFLLIMSIRTEEHQYKCYTPLLKIVLLGLTCFYKFENISKGRDNAFERCPSLLNLHLLE